MTMEPEIPGRISFVPCRNPRRANDPFARDLFSIRRTRSIPVFSSKSYDIIAARRRLSFRRSSGRRASLISGLETTWRLVAPTGRLGAPRPSRSLVKSVIEFTMQRLLSARPGIQLPLSFSLLRPLSPSLSPTQTLFPFLFPLVGLPRLRSSV